MDLTTDLLCDMVPQAKRATMEKFLDPLKEVFAFYKIDTPLRIAMFMAQTAHECMGYTRFTEIASGDAYDTGKLAERLGNTPEDDGDGEFYKGRGIIMTTGYYNYKAITKAFKHDFIMHPEDLLQPYWSAWAAGWYWNKRKLNRLADKGDLKSCTICINGGLNGLNDRMERYNHIKNVLGI